jgi:hypothetical protein
VPFVLDGPADLERLRQFRTDHPDILIGGGGFGTWQALIPEPNGETVVVRYTLRELLDKLDDGQEFPVRSARAAAGGGEDHETRAPEDQPVPGAQGLSSAPASRTGSA